MEVDLRELTRGRQAVEHRDSYPTPSTLDTGALLRIADAQEKLVEHHKSIDESLTFVVWLGTGMLIGFILFLYVYAGQH
jgi:hypothetical protein